MQLQPKSLHHPLDPHHAQDPHPHCTTAKQSTIPIPCHISISGWLATFPTCPKTWNPSSLTFIKDCCQNRIQFDPIVNIVSDLAHNPAKLPHTQNSKLRAKKVGEASVTCKLSTPNGNQAARTGTRYAETQRSYLSHRSGY
jgi:hypothetical protein